MKTLIEVIAAVEYRGMGDSELSHHSSLMVKSFSAYQCMKDFFPDNIEDLSKDDFEECFNVQKSGPFIVVSDNDGEMNYTFVKVS